MKAAKQIPFDIQSLDQLRDELKVQAHLFAADVKKEWERLEKEMEKFRAQALPVARAAEKSIGDVKAASEILYLSLKHGYDRIKRALPK